MAWPLLVRSTRAVGCSFPEQKKFRRDSSGSASDGVFPITVPPWNLRSPSRYGVSCCAYSKATAAPLAHHGTLSKLGDLVRQSVATPGSSHARMKGGVGGMMRSLFTRKLLAQAVAAMAIAVFWCISTVGTTVGVTSLVTAINAVISTPANAGNYRRIPCLGKPRCRGDYHTSCRRRSPGGNCCVEWWPCAAG